MGGLQSPLLCTAACVTSGASVVIAACTLVASGGASTWVSELRIHDSTAFAARSSAPAASLVIPARINCVLRVRGGGCGDWEGSGALVAVGRSDGVVSIYDTLVPCGAAMPVGAGTPAAAAAALTELASWESPGRLAVYSLDVSPCGGFLVAGCAQGTLAVFALPALSAVVPLDTPSAADGEAATLLESFVSGAVALGSAVESARGVAKFGKAIAGEAGSVVRGLFSSLWGGGGSSGSSNRR
jgi:hypothetical protein